MPYLSAYEMLAGMAHEELYRASDHLNKTGFVTDEEGLCLGSVLIEHWSERCTNVLREHGYASGRLLCMGQHFSHRGAIYVLYDADRHDMEEAIQELQRAALIAIR